MTWGATLAMTARGQGIVMGIEDGGLTEVVIEGADEDVDHEYCPGCEVTNWLRAISVYGRGTCWVVFCGGCGRTVEERWNILP